MFTAADYRKYAQERISAARNAASDARRKYHLDMAMMWAKAAVSLDERKPNPHASRGGAAS